MRKIVLILLIFWPTLISIAFGDELISTSPAGAKIYFITPKNGQTVPRTFKVKFGLKGMEVAPAGVNKPNSGHHHLLIDLDVLPDMKQPLPSNHKIRHYGQGQTQTEVTLAPGQHTMQLLLGNFVHIPHRRPVLSEKITIMVK